MGVFTSGGTESIIMAVRAYKEMHRINSEIVRIVYLWNCQI